jgi:hypothetical protein
MLRRIGPYIAGLLVLVLLPATALAFKDLSSTHWAYPYVTKLVEQYQIIKGYPDDTYRGNKNLTRYEFSKALVSALGYIEKVGEVSLKAKTTKDIEFTDVKSTHWAYDSLMQLVSEYQVITGYPDKTFRGNRNLTRYEISVAMAKALTKIEDVSGKMVAMKPLPLTDVPSDHWAHDHVVKLVSAGVISGYPDKTFRGNKTITRYELASLMVKFVDFALIQFEKEPPVVKPPVKPPVGLVGRSVTIPETAQAHVSGGWGNVFEAPSGTNNWLSYKLAATYEDKYDIFGLLSGNYEVSGKYGFNQIVYTVPSGGGMTGGNIAGGGVTGGVVYENRLDVELDTVYPIIDLFGINGKAFVGLKYANLNNSTAPTDFTGLKLGFATAVNLVERDFLARLFYTMPLIEGSSQSVLGVPRHFVDYEVSTEMSIYDYPVLVGFAGEIINLSADQYFNRFYNTVFVRYFLW